MLPIPTFGFLISTAQQMEVLFNKVKGILLINPTDASDKLAEVLGELCRILEFVEKETVRYLEIIFLPDKSNYITCRSVLLSLESGYVTIKGYEARGHCHKIANIYEKYLDKWFSSVLDPQDTQDIEMLFDRLKWADADMIDSIREITYWLKEEAEEILNLVDSEQLDTANQRIKSARIGIQQTRRDIVDALAQMKMLQASFISSAQTI